MYNDKVKLHQREKKHKQGSLRTISIDVTPVCNMSCSHCYADTFMQNEPFNLIAFEKTVDELYKLGVFHYVLQGGEPIADPDRLEKIFELIRPDESYITLVSNGWEMTKDVIQWLRKLGVDKIAFSLDSGDEKEHDENRREGSFKKVMEAVDNVLDVGLDVSISTVVTHESLYSEGFNKAYEYVKSKKLRFDVQIAEPVGKWDGVKELLITKEDAAYIKKLQRESPLTWNGREMIKRDIYCDDCDHCPAGTEFMAISADGHVLPCNFLQYSLGKIQDESITKMRKDLLRSNWFSELHHNCIVGEDEEFIDSFVMPFVGQNKPLDAYKVFNLRNKQ